MGWSSEYRVMERPCGDPALWGVKVSVQWWKFPEGMLGRLLSDLYDKHRVKCRGLVRFHLWPLSEFCIILVISSDDHLVIYLRHFVWHPQHVQHGTKHQLQLQGFCHSCILSSCHIILSVQNCGIFCTHKIIGFTPRKRITWNLKITRLQRKIHVNQSSIIVFQSSTFLCKVDLQLSGCRYSQESCASTNLWVSHWNRSQGRSVSCLHDNMSPLRGIISLGRYHIFGKSPQDDLNFVLSI